MTAEDLKKLVKSIVRRAVALKNKHTQYQSAPVNYACVFSHSQDEYQALIIAARQLGRVIQTTPTGPLFHIRPLPTVAGNLKLLKIRQPDTTRPERGDADFTIDDFTEFEKKYLSQPGFKIITKPNFYMLELMDTAYDVRVYFSNPPLDKQLKIN